MRIAIMGTKYSPPQIRGGEDMVIHELKRELERRGHHVHAYVVGWRHFRDVDLASPEPNVIRLKVPYIRYLYHFIYAWQFRRILDNTKYDLFLNTHSHFGFRLKRSPHLVIAATTSKGEAQAMRVNSPIKALEWLIRATLAFWVERGIYRDCDHIIAVSPHIKNEITTLYGTSPQKIAAIGNGVDVTRFCPIEREQAKVPVIFTACRLVMRKNVALLIQAAACLKAQGTRFKIRLAGEGDQYSALQQLVCDLGVGEEVSFLGRIDADRMICEYRHSEIFVLPSRYEGMPMVLLESQACAVPGVVAPFLGAEHVIRHGENGLIMKDDNPEELARLLDELIRDGQRRAEMGKNARARMISDFSWASVVDRYLALLTP